MSRRKYKFHVTDMNALAAAYPNAIEETIIPARVERKVSYSYIAKLLDLNLPVAGIAVEDSTDEPAPIPTPIPAAIPAASETELPAFLRVVPPQVAEG